MPQDSPLHDADLEIARAILDKDEAVATRFFEESHDRLYHFVLSRCEHAQDAEEITQETWVTAIENLETYKGTSALLTWMCGIARYKISDRIRRRHRTLRRRYVEDFEVAIDSLFEGRSDTNVLGLLEHEEVRVALAATLDLLPEDYQRVLQFKYIDELTVREIATQLDRGEKATESLLIRAKSAFRDLWRVQTGEVISLRGKGTRRRRPLA